MKKILFSIIALLGVLSANADTTWDFTSVSDADYAALGNDAVNWAKANNVVGGYPDGSISPKEFFSSSA